MNVLSSSTCNLSRHIVCTLGSNYLSVVTSYHGAVGHLLAQTVCGLIGVDGHVDQTGSGTGPSALGRLHATRTQQTLRQRLNVRVKVCCLSVHGGISTFYCFICIYYIQHKCTCNCTWKVLLLTNIQ